MFSSTGTAGKRWRRFAAPAVLVVALAACSGGGSGDGGSAGGGATDPIDEPASAGGERAVQFTGPGNVRLAATFATAPGGPVTGVTGALLIPDLGPGDRNGPITSTGQPERVLGDLSKALTESGVATLRYDRRGTGESKIEGALTFDDVVGDAKAGLELLSQRRETAGAKLAVVAYGSAGLVALRLAATDPRVGRVVLVSAPGRPLVDVQAAQTSATNGPESGDALRTAVAGLLANGSLPALDSLRAELRPLLPQAEAGYLASIYRLDPVAEARAVKVPTLLFVGARSDAATTVDADLLRSAVGGGAEVAVAPNAGASLLVLKPPLDDDPADFNSLNHIHGAAPTVDPGTRDPAILFRLTSFVKAGAA